MRTSRSTPGAGTPPHPGAAHGGAVAPPVRGRRAHAGPPADEPFEAAMDRESAWAAQGGRRYPERWRPRPRTVRAKIVSLLMVPVVSLLALWGFATVTTAQDVARLRQLQDIEDHVRHPVDQVVSALQNERRTALRQIAAPSPERAAAFRQQTGTTDSALAVLALGDDHTVADAGDLPPVVAERLDLLTTTSAALPGLRTAVLGRKADWDRAFEQYTAVISAAFGVHGALAGGVQSTAASAGARVLNEFGRAAEMLAREDALLSAAQAQGTFRAERRKLFTGAVGTRRALIESSVGDLPAPERAAWGALTAQAAYQGLEATEDTTVNAPSDRRAAQAVSVEAWESANGTVRTAMHEIEERARSAAGPADPIGDALLTPAGAAVFFGLAAVAAALVVSARIGRALVIELVSLRNTALEIARYRLPRAMRVLRAGEKLDVRAEAPEGPPPRDEVAEVGQALWTVHRAALDAAVERAELSRGISGVFVNLARRSQVLVHRQLNLLDSMERRAEDPDELSDLFRLDHLTTRMRRHAESLIILSGSAPGRAWRTPVLLTNVVRAAVSEVEDYARVDVRPLPQAAVIGTAVADLTHLLAELVENATQFSPPHTRVRVNGEPVPNGYAIEIEDRGLGMGKEALAEANRRVEETEALDIFDSDRLGLFVVSKLSVRHDVKVRLRTSPFGGTTAVVLVPNALLQSTSPSDPDGPDGWDEEAAGSAYTFEAEAEAEAEIEAEAEAGTGTEAPPLPGVIALRSHSRTRPGHEADELQAPPSPEPRRPPPSPDTVADAQASGSLPRRVRQSHLVPQLRPAGDPDARGGEATRQDDRAASAVPECTPEQARERMSAFRAGWTRGGGAAQGRAHPRDTTHLSELSERKRSQLSEVSEVSELSEGDDA
ncbi:nitrate- and nitrite sensing domain-containing protein [Streptomyces sp. NPDC019396]|uniref:sensor histidine kinase n=1 Tax=Streptomyces sp. NPDC019396 TaxID=3154687 RepID=UPI00340BD521